MVRVTKEGLLKVFEQLREKKKKKKEEKKEEGKKPGELIHKPLGRNHG